MPDYIMSNTVVTLQKLAHQCRIIHAVSGIKMQLMSNQSSYMMDDNKGETWEKLFMSCSQNCLNKK